MAKGLEGSRLNYTHRPGMDRTGGVFLISLHHKSCISAAADCATDFDQGKDILSVPVLDRKSVV